MTKENTEALNFHQRYVLTKFVEPLVEKVNEIEGRYIYPHTERSVAELATKELGFDVKIHHVGYIRKQFVGYLEKNTKSRADESMLDLVASLEARIVRLEARPDDHVERLRGEIRAICKAVRVSSDFEDARRAIENMARDW